MDNDKVNEVLQKYATMMIVADVPAVRHTEDADELVQPTRQMALEHLHWMCNEAGAWGPERLEKKFRWLGFIQGALWSFGVANINRLKIDNMPTVQLVRVGERARVSTPAEAVELEDDE